MMFSLRRGYHLSFIVCAAITCLSQSFSPIGSSSSTRLLGRRPSLIGASSHHDVPCQRKRQFRIVPSSTSQTRLASSLRDDEIANQELLLDSLRSMRVKELKFELESLKISTRNALEKEELVQRLYKARIEGETTRSDVIDNDVDGSGEKKKKKKKRRRYDEDNDDDDDLKTSVGEPTEDYAEGNLYNANPGNAAPTTSSGGGWTITTPFIYHELEPSKSIAAQNANDIYIRPSPGKYAAIKVQLLKQGRPTSVEWTLLVDTACSGLVLSPNAVAKANQQVPGILQTINNAGTMTMAGSSSQGTTSVARWDTYTSMIVGGVEVNLDPNNAAACQDIGALPSGLDGILGLSFLNQFACVDFDFVNNELRLQRSINSNNPPLPPIPNIRNEVVAQGSLSLTKLRIYAADVTLDGRGPVKLLVDTGAASSFLNWAGVADMKLSSTATPHIEPIREQIGAMGADNMALKLTHRYTLRRRWNLVAANNAVGDFCPGIGLSQDGDDQCSHVDIDIADLPVLESLKGDGVGGILGADLLMMCDVVRFCGLNDGGGSSLPKMILMK